MRCARCTSCRTSARRWSCIWSRSARARGAAAAGAGRRRRAGRSGIARSTEVPEGPTIIIANEFFDALPVHQAVMCADGWHERVVKIADNGSLQFGHARDPIPLFDQMLPRPLRDAPIGAIFEWRADQIALELGRRVVHYAGRRAGDRLRPRRKRRRRHLPGGRPPGVRQPAARRPATSTLPPMWISRRWRMPPQALGARVHGPIEPGRRSCAGSASRPAPRRSRRARRSARTPRSTARWRA